jgi:gas vesicle protein
MSKGGWGYFFLGLGAGVGLGLILAPESGEEMRGTLKNKADEGKDFLKKQTTDWRESASTVVDKGREALHRQRDTLNDAIQAGKQAYREKVASDAPDSGTV